MFNFFMSHKALTRCRVVVVAAARMLSRAQLCPCTVKFSSVTGFTKRRKVWTFYL